MRRRFFVDQFENSCAILRGDTAEHLGRVLRAEPGQLYELSDGHRVWLGRIERVTLSKRGENSIEFALVEPVETREPSLEIYLLVSLVKFDRFEWCLEKATELGVTGIIPLAAARTDKPLVAAAEKRRERWGKILAESAQQSRRLRPSILREVVRPEDAFAQSHAACKIFLSERREVPPLRAVLHLPARQDAILASEENAPMSAALAIGPEGGWTGVECAAARAAGFAEASLGENVLRTETAVLAGLAILHFAFGG